MPAAQTSTRKRVEQQRRAFDRAPIDLPIWEIDQYQNP